MHKLIDEFGLKEESHRLSFKDYTVATINNNFIDNKTRKISYCLDFINSYINTMNYDVAKKATAKRLVVIKDIIVANKRFDLEKDFENESKRI